MSSDERFYEAVERHERVAELRAEREQLEREIHDRGKRLSDIYQELVALGAIGGHR